MALLSIVIGIVFVLLLFSLLATTVMEMIAGLLSLRGKSLLLAIQDMIGGLKNEFTDHPFFQQLTIGSNVRAKGKALPSYISSWNFSEILMDIMKMNEGDPIKDRIETLPPNSPLRKILMFLYKQTGEDVRAFKIKLENWYNEVMDRASGAYKRQTRYWLFGIGVCVALIFNVDTITVYHNLSINASLRDFVANEATKYVNNNQAPNASPTPTTNFNEATAKIGTLVNDNIEAISSPLGLGWENEDLSQMRKWQWWLYKLAGWLTTALAISLGASFWFDLLKKLVGIRGSGPAPATVTATETAQAQPPVTVTTQTPVPVTVIPGGSFLTKPGSDSPFESTSRSVALPKPKAKRTPKPKLKPESGPDKQ